MVRTPTAGAALVALLLGLATLAGLTTAHAGGAGGTTVEVATSGDFSERIDRIPITQAAGAEPEVVMSLTAPRLPSLVPGDRLEISSELQVTVDCDESGPRCLGRPYQYNPAIDVEFVLAPDGETATGSDVIALGAPRREICRQRHPNREHHCVIVFSRDVSSLPSAPCLLQGCSLNLVASASSPAAGRSEFLAVGGLRPDGSVPQDRSRLNITRFHQAGEVRVDTLRTERRLTPTLDIDQHRQVIYAQPLDGLVTGDQLVAEARAEIDISKLPYNVVLSSQLILTDSMRAIDRGSAKRIASLRGEFDEGNAFNCTKNRHTCTIDKVGVLRMKGDAGQGSAPSRLYVALVARAGPKTDEFDPDDQVKVLDTGALDARRYRVNP